MWGRHHSGVPYGVVDVGSNTVRLLVATGGKPVLSLRATLGLGACVERSGEITESKLVETADHVGRFVAAAREAGARDVEVLITSPGRQAANGPELLDAIADVTTAPARILSAQEEGRLAFAGALGALRLPPGRRVTVVDAGGGSTQLVVGSAREGIVWSGTIDLGSRRLTSRLLAGDPPGLAQLEAARAEVDGLLESLAPPPARTAIAVGGSARALRRLVNGRLGEDELAGAVDLLGRTSRVDLVDHYDVDPARAETLAAGATIFAAVQAKLGRTLKVVRAGLREGAVAELGARRRRAA
jgi:exopolyphosphatase/guanosine-5'-triphosphate,3'-diphosphate pyrophosphatase